MKVYLSTLISLLIFAGGLYSEDSKIFSSKSEKESYSMGVDIGRRMKAQSIHIDTPAFVLGLKDAMGGDKLLLTDSEMKSILLTLQKELKEKQQDKTKSLRELNKKEEEVFLNENLKKEGITALPSGLQYRVLKEGTGKTPGINDTVICNYRGTLTNGTEFDSSYKRGEPSTFPLKGVIPGWTEILQLMKEGSKWQVYVPSHLAYGDQGVGEIIAPNSVLIFEIELISIK